MAHKTPSTFATTPNVRHLEWFHDHVRIEALLFDNVRTPIDGELWADLTSPGHGLILREADAEKHRVA